MSIEEPKLIALQTLSDIVYDCLGYLPLENITSSQEDKMDEFISDRFDKLPSPAPKEVQGVWVKADNRMPGFYEVVEWRNGEGGNIPLGKRTVLEHYKKVGPNTSWHEWFDSYSHPAPVCKEASVLIQGLQAYGKIHTVEGVVYPEGTHDELIEKADKWLSKYKQISDENVKEHSAGDAEENELKQHLRESDIHFQMRKDKYQQLLNCDCERCKETLEEIKRETVAVEDWISVEKPPIAYKIGSFDGKKSGLVLTINKEGKQKIALSYQGEMDGHKFCEWYDEDDFEIKTPTHWRELPKPPTK